MLITKDNKQLKKAFRKYMSRMGLTVDDVARLTKLDKKTVRNILQAKTDCVNIPDFFKVVWLLFGPVNFGMLEEIVKNA